MNVWLDQLADIETMATRSPLSTMKRIFILDDETEYGEVISSAISGAGVDCITTSDASDVLERALVETDVIILDLLMPHQDGIEILRNLAQQRCTASIILMSGIDLRVLETAERTARALGLNVAGHLQKPFHIRQLESLIAAAGRSSNKVKTQQANISIGDSDLRLAIEEKQQFFLQYQPQIDLATGEIAGLEALVRWRHPALGVISPDRFISRLELLGLIDQLGWIVIQLGLKELASIHIDAAVEPRLSLNLSARSLVDLRFPDRLLEYAGDHRIHHDRLTVEVTESSIIQDLGSCLDVLARLRMKGIGISIDDFGTGYAGLRHLHVVPATEIKIDKSYVQKIFASESHRILIEKTIEIGHELGMLVVAEGVERIEEVSWLRKKQCDLSQGFYFSPPMALNDLSSWAKTRGSLPS